MIRVRLWDHNCSNMEGFSQNASGMWKGNVTGPIHARWVLVVLILFGCLAFLEEAYSKELNPEDDYCGGINDPLMGNEIVLRPGVFQGPCKIKRGGSVGSPLVVRAADQLRPSRIRYDGSDSNILEIYADNVVVRGLEFADSRNDVDGVRVFSARNIVIEDCRFINIGGIAIVANHSSVTGLTIRRNAIFNTRSTAMYFGCHDGASCLVRQLVVENNYIHGVSAPEPQVGYGIQVKLNSSARIRDNIITDTKGPGIMVYGANVAGQMSTIERNFTAKSRTSSGIVLGGGPANVWNNLVVENYESGIALQDYDRRGLLKQLAILHNTVYNNKEAGFRIDTFHRIQAEFSWNAIGTEGNSHASLANIPNLVQRGNIDCKIGKCFNNPEIRDFSPLKESPLFGVRAKPDGSLPSDDFFKHRRSRWPVVGAVERRGPPIVLRVAPF